MKEKKENLQFIAITTILCYLLAHGYRIGNMMFSGDSLLMIYQNDYAWQIALGRCFQPIWLFIRGTIASPWLISFLAIVWLILSVYFLADILNIKSRLLMIAVSMVMTINLTFTVANATFLPWVDFYSFALFMAIFGVWLIEKKKILFYATGSVLLALSLGTYQSYICVAVALMMILVMQDLYKKRERKEILGKIAGYFGSLMLAGVFYFACWKIFQGIFHIWTADSYNGLAGMGDYTGVTIPELIALTYKNVFYYFWNPEVFISLYFRGISLSVIWTAILRILNIFVLFTIIISVIQINVKRKTNWWQRILQGIILLLFSLGINAVCILSKGMEHSLMVYAFIFIYIFAVKLVEDMECNIRRKSAGIIAIVVALGMVSWVNAVYSNQVYMKKHLQETAAISLMTRIVHDIEGTEGYVPGVTPVAFVGSFNETLSMETDEAFKDLLPYGTSNTSMFYIGTDYALLMHMLNVNMNLIRLTGDEPELEDMPNYPMEGSVAYVGEVLVVKISDDPKYG